MAPPAAWLSSPCRHSWRRRLVCATLNLAPHRLHVRGRLRNKVRAKVRVSEP